MNLNKLPKYLKLLAIGIAFISLYFCFFFNTAPPNMANLNNITFSWLRELRLEKEATILNYLNNAAQNAQQIAEDKILLNYFFKNYSQKTSNNENNENQLDYHFVTKFHDYFDILFINKDGFIFNSVKHEKDFHKNLFEGELGKTKFAKKLKKNNKTKFIGYEYYYPSDEFAAFFPVPIQRGNIFYGWIVLQLPINAVNTILLNRTGLGKTGEVYLVQENKMLLSESRFIENAASKNIEVNTYAVSQALKDISGEKIITDYRGVNVYSSYSKIKFLNSSFPIIAEIEEDEVISKYFLENEDFYSEKITDYYKKRTIKKIEYFNDTTSLKRVDINEYSKTDGSKILFTKGIATCSAAIIFKPNEFGYLTHIPPIDRTYYQNDFIETITNFSLQLFYNISTTDFLKEIAQRIIYYEITPSKINTLELVFVANHKKSFNSAINEVIKEGIAISKIKFMYNPKALNSNTYFNLSNKEVIVEWNYNDKSIFESSKSIKTIGEIIKELN